MRTLPLFIALILVHCMVCAQEFMPYPRAAITEAQWNTYLQDVEAKHASSKQVLAEHNLVLFHDSQTGTSYAFTQPNHPAHPAWVTRTIVRKGAQFHVQQVGYFAGDEPAFAALFKAYQQTNAKMIEDMNSNAARRKP